LGSPIANDDNADTVWLAEVAHVGEIDRRAQPFPTSVVNTDARYAATLGCGFRHFFGPLGKLQRLTREG
jgi:hypothetical protein